MFPVVYDRPLARESSRSGSFSSSGKRSTKPTAAAVGQQTSRYVKKEVTQLSPVKKRIKENKDHYIGNEGFLLGGWITRCKILVLSPSG